MNATIKRAIQSDWSPIIEATVRALVHLIAAVIVLAQWAQFTWLQPWAGVMAVISSPRSAGSPPRSRPTAPLLLMPAAPVLLLAAAPEPIAPTPAASPARKRGRRATRQPKMPATA
jgi:hypothetical protein